MLSKKSLKLQQIYPYKPYRRPSAEILQLQFLQIYLSILDNPQEIEEAVKIMEVKKGFGLSAIEGFFNQDGNVKLSYEQQIDKRYINFRKKSPNQPYMAASISHREEIILYAVKMASFFKLSVQHQEALLALSNQEAEQLHMMLAMAPEVLNNLQDARLNHPRGFKPSLGFKKQIINEIDKLGKHKDKQHSPTRWHRWGLGLSSSFAVIGGLQIAVGLGLFFTGVASLAGLILISSGAGLLAINAIKANYHLLRLSFAQTETKADIPVAAQPNPALASPTPMQQQAASPTSNQKQVPSSKTNHSLLQSGSDKRKHAYFSIFGRRVISCQINSDRQLSRIKSTRDTRFRPCSHL